MNNKWRMLSSTLVLLAVCAGGCKPQGSSSSAPDSPPAATQSKPDWEKRGEEMAAQMKLGMTDDDVEKMFGKPTRHRTVIGGDPITIWSYQLKGSAFFVVRFDRNSRVLSWLITSPTPIQ
jgi:hypothetical protein